MVLKSLFLIMHSLQFKCLLFRKTSNPSILMIIIAFGPKSLPIADQQTLFFVFLNEPYVSLWCPWWKSFDNLDCFSLFLTLQMHAQQTLPNNSTWYRYSSKTRRFGNYLCVNLWYSYSTRLNLNPIILWLDFDSA